MADLHCSRCRRAIRPRNATIEQYPRTLRSYSGKCSVCSTAKSRQMKSLARELSPPELVARAMVEARAQGDSREELLLMLGIAERHTAA